MDQTNFTTDGFPQIFSDMVATASMILPPMVNEGDTEFLQTMLVLSMQTFWNEYFAGLSPEANAEREQAISSQDPEQLLLWFSNYADFENNPEARGLAAAIIESMNEELPALMQEKYQIFRSALVA